MEVTVDVRTAVRVKLKMGGYETTSFDKIMLAAGKAAADLVRSGVLAANHAVTSEDAPRLVLGADVVVNVAADRIVVESKAAS